MDGKLSTSVCVWIGGQVGRWTDRTVQWQRPKPRFSESLPTEGRCRGQARATPSPGRAGVGLRGPQGHSRMYSVRHWVSELVQFCTFWQSWIFTGAVQE